MFRLRLIPAWYTWLYAAESTFASLNFTDHRLNGCAEQFQKGKTGASRRNRFSFSPMSDRFTNRCLSVATIAAIDLPIAAAICLVAFRAKSVVRCTQLPPRGGSDPGLGPSANQPGMLQHRHRAKQHQPDQLPRMPYYSSEIYLFYFFGLGWQDRSLQRQCHPSREIARKHPFNSRYWRLSMLTYPFDVSIISMLIQMDVGWIWFIPCLHNLTVKIWKELEAHESWEVMSREKSLIKSTVSHSPFSVPPM